MTHFVVVDGRTGRIIRTGICPESMLFLQELEAHEVVLAEEANEELHYYSMSPLMRLDRPRLGAELSATSIRADGVSEVSLRPLPNPCVVMIDDDIYRVHDGQVDISFDLPGSYIIRVKAFPYLSVDFTLTAT